MLNVINEPKLVHDLNNEYYKLINFYSNTKRTANFIKYFNLNFEESPRKRLTNETYDFYMKTKNRWDIYDLTPMQIISAIQNAPDNAIDLKGNMIVSATTILVYTIDNPRIGDLVTFYKPVESDEVLRVTNVRLQLNSNYSSTPVKWFELDLETAPIKYENLDKLIKNDHFVYDLTIEKNIQYDFYKQYVQVLEDLEKQINKFTKYFDALKDMYIIENFIIRELNELMYFFKKKFDNKFYRLFETVRSPFGYWDHYSFMYKNINDMTFNHNQNFHLINLQTNQEQEYNRMTRNDSEKLNNVLIDLEQLLTHIREIEVYIDHPTTRTTSNIK